MEKSSVEPVRHFDRLNQSLVESKIDFGRTVHFTAEIDLTEIERVRHAAGSGAMNWERHVMAGAQAARFFARICALLQNPDELSTVADSPAH